MGRGANDPLDGMPDGALDAVVSARDVSIEYRSDGARARLLAVAGVSFELAPGEVLGIIGESGSGKSTLARAISGIGGNAPGVPRICGGELDVLGTPLRRASRTDRRGLGLRVGYLPQDGAQLLDPSLTVADNVAEPIFSRDRRFDPAEAIRAVATLVDAVHLPLSVLRMLPYELSSGQLQRVALARALVLDPELLVADEPIRGVDIMVRHDVLHVIPELQSARGFSAIVVSSDLSVVIDVADRVAVMQDGMIVGLGPLASLIAAPAHPYLKVLARTLEAQEHHPDGR